jgi:hypothetical protein
MLFQYVAGRFELSVFPHAGVSDLFLTVIGQGIEISDGQMGVGLGVSR